MAGPLADNRTVWLPQEVALLTSQVHPFILPVVEMLRDAPTGEIGMVTEYCDQGDLHSLLINLRQHGERVPEGQVLTWLAQLCLALSHLHGQRILHRDVKTSNIFVAADRTLKLGDFGLARAVQAQEAVMSRVGSPFYMSPEICQNRPYGAESDIWSLGCVLYEIVCLSPAFYAESMALVLERICSAAYDPPAEGVCSDGVRELLGKMLQLDPSARPSALEVLQHDALRPVLQQLEPPEPPPAVLREHLAADATEVDEMRAAIAAAAEVEEAAAAEHARRQGAGLSLLGLSLLAERGLSLLGLSFIPHGQRRHAAHGSHQPLAPKPTPSMVAAEALAEANEALGAMHGQLEASLGAALLERALTVAEHAPPEATATEAAWASWEAGRLEALAHLLQDGQWHLPRRPALAELEVARLARAVLALALWRRANPTGGSTAAAVNRGLSGPQGGHGEVLGEGLFSKGGPWIDMLMGAGPRRAAQ